MDTWRRPVSWSLMRAWLASARRLWMTTSPFSWASSKESWWAEYFPFLPTNWVTISLLVENLWVVHGGCSVAVLSEPLFQHKLLLFEQKDKQWFVVTNLTNNFRLCGCLIQNSLFKLLFALKKKPKVYFGFYVYASVCVMVRIMQISSPKWYMCCLIFSFFFFFFLFSVTVHTLETQVAHVHWTCFALNCCSTRWQHWSGPFHSTKQN